MEAWDDLAVFMATLEAREGFEIPAMTRDINPPLNTSIEVSPRDVVAACSPDPAKIGHLMKGVVSAGLWVRGRKDGKERNTYIYQLADNEECMMELVASGTWQGSGVLGPENFPSEP